MSIILVGTRGYGFFDFYTDWSNILWWVSIILWVLHLLIKDCLLLDCIIAAAFANIIGVGIAGTYVVHMNGINIVHDANGVPRGSPEVDSDDMQGTLEYDMLFHIMPMLLTLLVLAPLCRFKLKWFHKVFCGLGLLLFALVWSLVPSVHGEIFLDKYNGVYGDPGAVPIMLVAISWILGLWILF